MKLGKFDLLLEKEADFEVVIVDVALEKSVETENPSFFRNPDTNSDNLNERTGLYSLGMIMLYMLVYRDAN